jgi:hypothetical protein
MANEKPALTVTQILRWADAHQRRTGEYPRALSGRVHGGAPETWRIIDRALRFGLRGLPGKSSLARLLHKERGVRNTGALPPLTEAKVLRWADAHHRQTGRWPNHDSGPVPGAPGESWANVDFALRDGLRGLPGKSSLANLLEKYRDVPNRLHSPRLTVKDILAWADAFRRRTGQWPTSRSGPIPESPRDTWRAVDNALRLGGRGMSGGSSLPQLLARHRGARNRVSLPRLSVQQVLAWAESHYRRTGFWPTGQSGPIPEAPGETWNAVRQALTGGYRGLPGGTSLAQLLRKHQRIQTSRSK